AVGLPGGPGRAQRHPAHRLDPTGDDDVVLAGHDAVGGLLDGGLARAAGPVHGDPAHGLGPAGGQHRVAADVGRLVPDLADTAPDDVVDGLRVDAGARDQCLQYVRGQVHRVDPGQRTVPLADRGADGLDDDGLWHGVLLCDLGAD